MDKRTIQKQIDLVRDLYNTSFCDDKGKIRSAPFSIILENKDSQLKVGIHHVEIHPDTTIKEILFALRKGLEQQLKEAPDKMEESTVPNDGIQAKEIEFRGKKYHYYPDNLEKVFRMDGSQLKDSTYTKDLIQHIKDKQDEKAG